MINISSLSFKYPNTDSPVLRNVNLEIKPSTLTLVTGSTGSGKTTLLHCINGLIPHFSGGAISGEIRVFGFDPIQKGPEKMSSLVGFVFQEPEAQFVFDTVENEIAFVLENAGMAWEQMQSRVDNIIHHLKLEGIRNKKINEISGGEKQKVAIASALVSQPKVLILDEPTSQLDPTSADDLLTFITKLKEDLQLTILISEHRLERLLPFADSLIHLTADKKLLFGTPQEILPQMLQVPPLIEIANRFSLSPLPLKIGDFPIIHTSDQEIPQITQHHESNREQTPAIEVSNLSVKYDSQTVLHRINLNLFPGEILALLGGNGSGKTTLLRSLLGLMPSSGHRFLYHKNMSQMGLERIIQHIAYLPQNPNDLLFAESILDELRITLDNHNMKMGQSELHVFLNKFGLARMKNRYPRDLSVGERQSTALAAITVHEPEIIFLDEPTRGLDYHAKRNLSKIIKSWRNENRSILLVTHDVEFSASVADRVVVLENGRIRFNGTPQKVFSDYPGYRTQTARLFPKKGWVIPEDII